MQNTPYPLVWLGDEGILRIDYGRNPRIDLAAISSAHAQHRALSLTPRPVLIRGEGTLTSTSEAEAFSISAPVCALTTAVALMQPNLAARLAVKLYLVYHRPPYPCQAFDDEAQALGWLSQYLPVVSENNTARG